MPIPFHNLGLEQNLKPGDPSLDYRGQWHRQHQPRLEQSAYRCSQSLPIAALVVESDNSLPSGLLLPIGVDHSLGVTTAASKKPCGSTTKGRLRPFTFFPPSKP